MLRFIDGFDHYTTDAATLQKYSSVTEPSYVTILPTDGRRGGGCLSLSQEPSMVSKTLENQNTWIVGFAFMTTLAVRYATPLVSFLDSGSDVQASLVLNAGQAIEIRRGSSTILATSSFTLSAGAWYYVEVRVTIHDTTGSAIVMVDGVEKINISGVDTKSTSLAGATAIRLHGAYQVTLKFDDLYICDATGTTNNTFLGDVRVDTIYPTAAGSVTEFTPVGTANNWDNTNDASPDGDTTYNTSATVDATDLLVFNDLTDIPGTIFGVQSNLNARKDDAGSGTMKAVALLSATEYEGVEHTMSDSYIDHLNIWEKNPNTTAAWTASEINGAEFGYKVSA